MKWEGVLFGALAILVAIWPALKFDALFRGPRAREREGTVGPVRNRWSPRPVQPVAIRVREPELALSGKGAGA